MTALETLPVPQEFPVILPQTTNGQSCSLAKYARILAILCYQICFGGKVIAVWITITKAEAIRRGPGG